MDKFLRLKRLGGAAIYNRKSMDIKKDKKIAKAKK